MNIVLAFTVIAIGAINGADVGVTINSDWVAFKKANGMSTFASLVEEEMRATNFLQTLKNVKEHNSNPNADFQLETNFFAPLTDAERKAYTDGTFVPTTVRTGENVEFTADLEDRAVLPATLDLRTNKCLVAIKNQKSCGSCWAFTTIAPLEFAKCKKTNTVVSLSEEQLVDCDNKTTNKGCSGGWYTTAWDYLKNCTGSAKTASYPYTAPPAGTCKFNPNKTASIGAKVKSWSYVQTMNATAMQIALQNYGPLAVAITVIPSFQSYKSGVYTDVACDNKPVNHGVVVVGWSVSAGKKVWITRNSWGLTWGNKGYILMQRGVNKCSIEKYPAYVVPV